MATKEWSTTYPPASDNDSELKITLASGEVYTPVKEINVNITAPKGSPGEFLHYKEPKGFSWYGQNQIHATNQPLTSVEETAHYPTAKNNKVYVANIGRFEPGTMISVGEEVYEVESVDASTESGSQGIIALDRKIPHTAIDPTIVGENVRESSPRNMTRKKADWKID
jgi:hypothetical protein